MRLFFRHFGIVLIAAVLLAVCGCSSSDGGSHASSSDGNTSNAAGDWDNSPKVLTPAADGTSTIGNDSVLIDISNISEGYIMVKYSGSASKIKLFVTTPDSVKYTYDLTPSSEFCTVPLTGGNGSYAVSVMEHVVDNKYSSLFNDTLNVALSDEFRPFLYPNQYTWFTADSTAVAKASELTADASDTLSAIGKIYDYVISNITYDYDKADSVTSSYLPDVDSTLAEGTGICFDYAALMTAMLRSQGIPTKLEIGYSGEVYHAWISAYTEETGWIGDIIHFDGNTWSLMDPTLAASNSSSSVKSYVGDGSNYTVKYSR